MIAEHNLCVGKGKLVKNRSHSRNRESDIDELFAALSNQLDTLCDDFLTEIRQRKGRYIRDHYGLIDKLIREYGVSSVIITIAYCQKYELFSATDLKDTLEYPAKQIIPEQVPATIPIKTITNSGAATVVTQKRSIGAYVSLGGEAI